MARMAENRLLWVKLKSWKARKKAFIKQERGRDRGLPIKI